MATALARLSSPATTRPAEWDALMPTEEGVPWQVWVRSKGSGYWIFRWATKLARLTSRIERALGRSVPDIVSNPNGIDEAVAVADEDEAREASRLFYELYGGRVAVTYGPVVVGRVHPLTSVPAIGDRKFDPFEDFDFSATEAVKERSKLMLITVDEYEQTRAILSGALRTEPRV